jgi:hypothetical protein
MRMPWKRSHLHVGCALCDAEVCMINVDDGAAHMLAHMVQCHWDVLEQLHWATRPGSDSMDIQLVHQFIDQKLNSRGR